MIDKKEFLLQSIIKAYIEHLEPIGSKELKSMYELDYSPATIRGYFKKLGDEGFLAQEHISSGRTPTNEALKQYWIGKLNFSISGVNIKAIEFLANKIGVTVFLKKEKSDILQSSLKDILKISKDVGAYELYSSINYTLQSSDFDIFNYKEFLSLALNFDFDEFTINKFLKGTILDELKEGLYFDGFLPQSYIGVCKFCKINNEDYKMFVVGELSKDYEYFFEQIINF